MSFDYFGGINFNSSDLQNQIAEFSKKINLSNKAEGDSALSNSSLFAANGLTNILGGLLGGNSSAGFSFMPIGNFNNPFSMIGGMTDSLNGLSNFFSALPPGFTGISNAPIVMGSSFFEMMGFSGTSGTSSGTSGAKPPKMITSTKVSEIINKTYNTGVPQNNLFPNESEDVKTNFTMAVTASINRKVILEKRTDYKAVCAEAMAENYYEYVKTKVPAVEQSKDAFINGVRKMSTSQGSQQSAGNALGGILNNFLGKPRANYGGGLFGGFGGLGLGGGYRSNDPEIRTAFIYMGQAGLGPQFKGQVFAGIVDDLTSEVQKQFG